LSQGVGARRRLFKSIIFFKTLEACARSAGRASAWATRLSTRNPQRRNGQSNVRRTTSGGNGLGTSIKYLRRTTSGAAGNGLSRYQGLLMCSFTTSALRSPCLVRASFANKQSSTAEGWGLGGRCLCVEPELTPCVHKKIYTNIVIYFPGGSK